MSIRGEYVDNLLFEALLDLAEENRLEKISVKQLAERAGVSRQTFYNHYADMNDIISRAPFHYVASRTVRFGSRDSIQDAYEFALEHVGFYSQLPNHKGQNNFRESFTEYVSEFGASRHITDDMSDDEKLSHGIVIMMYAHAITDIFLDWCEAGLSWPLDILLEAQDQMVPAFFRETQEARGLGADTSENANADSSESE